MLGVVLIKRVKGGLVEHLQAASGDYETHLGVAFQVPDATGAALVADGSGRFETATTAPLAPEARTEVTA